MRGQIKIKIRFFSFSESLLEESRGIGGVSEHCFENKFDFHRNCENGGQSKPTGSTPFFRFLQSLKGLIFDLKI